MHYQIIGPPARRRISAPDTEQLRKLRVAALTAETAIDLGLQAVDANHRCAGCGATSRSTRIIGAACDPCARRELGR